MAIDTKSLTEVITELRAFQAKDAITPENLGYILQRIVDLLATASTSDSVVDIQKFIDRIKAAGKAITELSQGQADPNHVYANKTSVNLASGDIKTDSGIFIQQATTERAGAMRAQHVIDLNAAKETITELETLLSSVKSEIKTLKESQNLLSVNCSKRPIPISVQVEEGSLYVLGARDLIEHYTPYLFRHTHRRSKNNLDISGDNYYCRDRKGWNLFGSCHTVRMDGNKFTFSTNEKHLYTEPAKGYSPLPDTLITTHISKRGIPTVAWGIKCVSLLDHKNPAKHRMIRLRFAIGFGPHQLNSHSRISVANLVSTLAEFSIVYDPKMKSWNFSR